MVHASKRALSASGFAAGLSFMLALTLRRAAATSPSTRSRLCFACRARPLSHVATALSRPSLQPRSTALALLSARRGGASSRGLASLMMAASSLSPEFSRTDAPSITKLEAPGSSSEAFTGDLLVLPVFQPEEGDGVAEVASQALLSAWDAKLDGAIADLVATKDFKGKAGSSARVRLSKGSAVRSLTLVGLGKKSALKDASFGGMGSALAGELKAEKPKSVGVVLPEGAGDAALALAAEELLVGLYVDNRFKTGDRVDKPVVVESLTFLGGSFSSGASSLATAKALAEGVRLTKDLVNAPANFATPRALADTARAISQEYGMSLKVLGEEECRALGMGSYLAVAQGSKDGPEFIHLTYTPKGTVNKRLVMIGKGLTFDSGGYNLKAGAGSMIELMKFDMGGAGAVLGAAKAIGQLQPKGVEVHVIVAACENMISDRACRPGDILTASNGKTIEVLNTDAEGRLTLADALVYAERNCQPDAIIDSATLTGACIIALGGEYAGMWSSNDDLAKAIEDAAKSKGEKVWRMPLAEEYKAALKSDIADLKNIGGREGGSITAALFLQEFVSAKIPWAHLDIAGPVWSGKKGGATGFGVRTLTQWVLNHAQP